MLAHNHRTKSFFVNVVSEVDDDIQVFLRQMTISGVITVLVVLARNKRETKLGRRFCRRGPGSTDRTHFATGREAIPIVCCRTKTFHFDVNRVPEFLQSQTRTLCRNPPELVVLSDFPIDARAGFAGTVQPRPQHNASRSRIS